MHVSGEVLSRSGMPIVDRAARTFHERGGAPWSKCAAPYLPSFRNPTPQRSRGGLATVNNYWSQASSGLLSHVTPEPDTKLYFTLAIPLATPFEVSSPHLAPLCTSPPNDQRTRPCSAGRALRHLPFPCLRSRAFHRRLPSRLRSLGL